MIFPVIGPVGRRALAAAFASALALALPAVVAAQPAPEPVPKPVPAADQPDDDVDITNLGLDSEVDDRLNIYGFADMQWRKVVMNPKSLAANQFPKENTFLIGNLNLYLTKSLTRSWRSFLEVRFTYAPNGARLADGRLANVVAPDPADLERPVQAGGIVIERAHLEYDVTDWLTVQAGSFLTPYGIWNVDHGSPVIIPVHRPYIIGEDLFPEQQTGLHIYGKRPIGRYELEYHATLSNGRGPFQSFRDLDSNKGVGGRLVLEAPWLGTTTRIGVSGYRGQFTDRPADELTIDSDGNVVNLTPAGVRYDEVSVGADLAIRRGRFHLQAEVISNDRRYHDGAREISRGVFVSNNRYVGAYAVAGYRFDRWWMVMPFVLAEYDRPRATPEYGDRPSVKTFGAGINLRPTPSVVLKLGFTGSYLDGLPVPSQWVSALATQAAWAF